ncbi:MAG TPA: beta-ketoacyl synthase N-terminal-like domain-containing protein, partial [Polyangiaceae bacterium]|nr:beta-ketoacyl synthase N-terminal-like domain-containing protein [Polyangiaceae bacterium]
YMVPAAYVALERLPLSANGKVDRGKLPAPFAGGDARAAHAPPASDLEKSIAAIWAEVLGAPSVGLDDNFFDLGGHSLLMARVQNRVREALGREVRIVSLFQHPTVRALAKFLAPAADGADGANGADAAPLAPYAERRRVRLGQRVPVAIIGMAGRFPGAGSVDELWANLRAGKEGITFFDDDELVAAGVSPALLARPDYVKAAGVIEGADAFDAAYFGYTPRDAQGLDPQQALLLETAVEALEHGGYFGDGYEGRVGVFAGGGMTTYLLGALSGAPQAVAGYDPFELMIGHDKDFATTRVSYKLNLRGPSYDVQTACSTSLVAVHLACQSLQSGECDLALAGGVSLTFPEKEGYLYREGAILSPDGHCRPFDAEARGTVGGSGVAMVLLKPLDAAIADGDTIYAVIKGSAVNNDGSGKVTYTAPSVDAQAEVIAEAQAVAGV